MSGKVFAVFICVLFVLGFTAIFNDTAERDLREDRKAKAGISKETTFIGSEDFQTIYKGKPLECVKIKGHSNLSCNWEKHNEE